MSTTVSLAQFGDSHFDSEWLRALVQQEPYSLPPPLPISPGALIMPEGTPASLGIGQGAQLAQYYYQRIDKAAEGLLGKRKIWA
jgi:hypothetical protein